jgi:hypothetical protein
VLRGIFGFNKEIAGRQTQFYDKQLYNLYSPNTIRMIKEGEMGRACNMNWLE